MSVAPLESESIKSYIDFTVLVDLLGGSHWQLPGCHTIVSMFSLSNCVFQQTKVQFVITDDSMSRNKPETVEN